MFIPRQEHLQHILQVFGYLRKYHDGALRFCTGIPDHESSFQVIEQEWEKMLYGPIKEEIPHNAPDPKELCMQISAWFNANLFFDLVTGRSAMGYMLTANQTPISYSSKLLSTVETATYATELLAGGITTDEVIALQ